MHLDPNGLEILAPAECRSLVEGNEFGRLAFADANTVTVLPVTYTVVDDHLVIRTTSGSKMVAASDRRPAALEIDSFDERRHTGWSVLVRGRLDLVDGEAEVAALDASELHSWVRAGGTYIRLSIDEVTGRRMHSRARLVVEPRSS
jgi:nitroimidazol reductase NimA-like FMN-containing flavoprotein (pyridoxamine 5'-phosphate oxidase superfamily)